MSARELVFDILAIDRASSVFNKVAASSEASGARVSGSSRMMSGAFLGAGVALGAIAVESLKTSGEMETAMTRLQTTAGESAAGVKMVWAGIDQLSGQVGYSVTQLGDAMYFAESGGYHAADALTVLTAAAQGAKVENANVTEVTHAVTGAMRDYNMTAGQAATVTNAMNTAVGHGMMTFNDLAEAFPKIGSRAAAAHVSLEETLSAMARMTSDGLPAANAATYLGQTIGQLSAPTAKARSEMASLGINATQLSQTMTSGSGHGLGDAIKMLYDGITSHLNPAGLVAINTFTKSKGAMSDWQKLMANIPPTLQTQVQALAASTGGVKSFQAVLMLGNDGLKGYNSTLSAVNASVKRGGTSVDGFAQQQATLNGKIADVKGAFSGLADELGQQLLPAAKSSLDALKVGVDWMSTHGSLTKGFGEIILGLASAYVAVRVGIAAYNVVQAISTGITALASSTFGTYVGVMALEGLAAFKGVIAAVKEWTIVQTILDVVLSMNPIGLIIAGIALLVTGIILAYQHCDTFRAICNTAFHAIATAASWMWNSVLKPVITYLLNGFGDVAKGIGDVLSALSNVPGFGWAKDAATALQGMGQAAIDAAAALNKVQSPPPIRITADASQVYSTIDNIRRAAATGININAKMAAMPGHATGTMNFTGGLTTINEKGPEIVDLPSGARIYTADQSKAMGGPRNGPLVNIEHYHEAGNSPQMVAADLMFRVRAAS